MGVPVTAPHLDETMWARCRTPRGPAGDGIEADIGDPGSFELLDVVAGLGSHDPRCPIHVLLSQPSFEQIGRFDRMIVDTDENQIFDLHKHLPPSFGSWRVLDTSR